MENLLSVHCCWTGLASDLAAACLIAQRFILFDRQTPPTSSRRSLLKPLCFVFICLQVQAITSAWTFELLHALFLLFTHDPLEWMRLNMALCEPRPAKVWEQPGGVHVKKTMAALNTHAALQKGLNYNRLLQINRSVKPAIIRMYTISISNCTRWKTIPSIVSDWQFVSTGENWRLFFHRLGLV